MSREYYDVTDQDLGYEPPMPTRRASLPMQVMKVPSGMPKREARWKFRVVFFGILGMVIFYAIIYAWVFVVEPTVTDVSNQWEYGNNRISVVSGQVHPGGKTLFISFQGEDKQIVVIVCEKGKYKVYIGPRIDSSSPLLVTVELLDINGDHRLDAVVHIQGSSLEFALINTGTDFKWAS